MSSHQGISELAYQLWVERGRPHGSHEDDWLEAERRLATGSRSATFESSGDGADPSLDGSFPASDPPASHTPDRPPSNAADKWRAAKPASPRASSARKQTEPVKRAELDKRGAHYPVDETDDGHTDAPGDIGEG